MQCYRHTKVETELRCGKCDRPICTACTRIGPAGARCPECASMRSSPLYSVPGSRIAAAIAVGTVVSMVAGRLILEVVSFGWFSLWAGFLVGTGLGELFLRLMARRRGVVPETVTGVCTAVGMLLSFLVFVAYPGFPRNPALFAALIRHYVMYFLCAGISVATAVARIKYI